jgi:hypothetical protein
MANSSLSLLSGEEIKEQGLVQGSTDDNLFRASTYDLSVGEIIPAGHWSGGKEYTVPSGGTSPAASISRSRGQGGVERVTENAEEYHRACAA